MPPPKPSHLSGRRRGIKDGSSHRFRLEVIVAAIQDLGSRTDKAVLNPHAKHLCEATLEMLRGWGPPSQRHRVWVVAPSAIDQSFH
jgi:hypothetical protein